MAGYRPPYTIDEQRKIIDYIVRNNDYSRMKGDRLWKDIADSGELKRSWHSLKQHFRKKLINQLHYPELKIDFHVQKTIHEYYQTMSRGTTNNKNTNNSDKNKINCYNTRIKEERFVDKYKRMEAYQCYRCKFQNTRDKINKGIINCILDDTDTSDEDRRSIHSNKQDETNQKQINCIKKEIDISDEDESISFGRFRLTSSSSSSDDDN